LNIQNWDFVKVYQQRIISSNNNIEPTEISPIENLLHHFHKFTYKRRSCDKKKVKKEEKGIFFIPRDKPVLILRSLSRFKNRFSFPQGTNNRQRSSFIFDILDKIANERIGLGRCMVFSQEIEELLTSNLEEESKISKNRRLIQVSTLSEYIENLSKHTTVLAVLFATLFSEHEQGKLTKEFIQYLLHFLGEFWRSMIKEEQAPVGEKKFLQKLHSLLKFKSCGEVLHTSNNHLIQTAWKILEVWLEKTGRDFHFIKAPFGRP
jgi:hypothetical protein